MKRLVQTIGALFSGSLTLFLLRLCGKELVRTGSCRCCGSCCRKINLRVGGKWLRSSAHFQRLQQEQSDYQRFVVCGIDEQGLLQFSCRLLQEDGRCGAYHDRLDLCKAFPRKSLALCGGVLPPQCGYEIGAAVPFDKRLKKALRKHAGEKDTSA